MNLDLKEARICVTGGAGFLGQSVCNRFIERDARVFVPRRSSYDLTDPASVSRLFDDSQPDIVVHLAAEVGGIGANRSSPGRFFYANMAMGLHLIEEARRRGVTKFVQIGTVCSYPKHTPVPFREEGLWNGFPEETNAPYGIAKKALLTMLDAYRAQYGFPGIYLIPVNLYGPGDNFDLETSHVIPAMIRKFMSATDQGAEEVVLWGTGSASREFLYVDDAARAIVMATSAYDDPEPVNIGTGREIEIKELADLISSLTGYQGRIVWDTSKPDGQPRRGLDTSRATDRFGFTAQVPLERGLEATIDWWQATGST